MRSHLRLRIGAVAALGVLAIGGLFFGGLAVRRGWFPATLFVAPDDAHGTNGGATSGGRSPSGDVRADRSIYGRAAMRGDQRPAADRPTGAVAKTGAQPGPTLIVCADSTEVRLVDAAGKTQHVWWRAFDDIDRWAGDSHWGTSWPPTHHGRAFFRDAHLFADGSLLVLFESIGLVRLGVDSKVRWASRVGQMHSAFDVGAGGEIYALSRQRVARRLGLTTFKAPADGIVEDEVIVLAADGEELFRFSLVDALLDSDHATLLEWAKHVVMLDAASLHVVQHGRFRGQLLISLRNLQSIVLVNPTTRRVTAALTGVVDRPCAATMVAGDRVLALDSGDAASVVECDLATHEVVWRYPVPDGPALHVPVLGDCQRLSNGNTLITESTKGRAIEVTPAGDVVWDYRSPYRLGKHVATLFRAERIRPGSLTFTPRAPKR